MTSSSTTNPRTPVFERVSTILGRVRENVAKRSQETELRFGLEGFDKAIGGIRRDKVTILAARVSEGKSSLALQAAANMAIDGKTIAYISLEDDRESLVERLFCQMEHVDNHILRKGDASAIDEASYKDIYDNLKLLVLDEFGYTIEEIQTVVDTLSPKPDVVFLDYVQMIDQAARESEYESLSRFARNMKVYAEKANIAVVLVSQINRQGARDGRPKLHHLANCGRLEQVADLVLLMCTPYYCGESSLNYDSEAGTGMKECPHDYVEVEVAKNKTGERGFAVKLRFIGSQYRFEKWEDKPWEQESRTY